MQLKHLVLVVSVSAAALTLAACGGTSTSDASQTPGHTSSATASSTASIATFSPQKSAEKNLPVVKFVVDATVKAQGMNADPVAVAQALVAAGVPTESISFTSNSTAIGLKADSVSVAVLQGSSCLLSQYGDAIGGVTAVIEPALAQGGCLIGNGVSHL